MTYKGKRAISSMRRKRVIELLESICIACYDDEPTSLLKEALIENVNDGNIDEMDLL